MNATMKKLLALGAVLFVALIVWVVWTTPDGPPQSEKIAPPPTMEYEGNEMSEEVNGVKIWDLTAERMIVDANTQNANLEKLIGHFYQADGRSIEFRAERGMYDYETKNIYVEGDILVETSDGARLICDRMGWVGAEEKLIAADNVKIRRDDIFATGDWAESSDGFRHFLLKGKAHIIKGFTDEESQSETQPELPPPNSDLNPE